MIGSKIQIFFISLFLLLSSCFLSCGDNAPMYLNSEEGLTKIQKEIDNLTKGIQIDSLIVRSTYRNSMMSSILIITTDENDGGEMKKSIEYIPNQDLLLQQDAKIKKEGLHAYKVNLPSLLQYIEKAKSMLPAGFSYVDVHTIKYAATPFGEKYYISLEVKTANREDAISNEYVEEFYTQNMVKSTDNTSDVYHIVNFQLESNNLELIKK